MKQIPWERKNLPLRSIINIAFNILLIWVILSIKLAKY